jgi:hypothetical protein
MPNDFPPLEIANDRLDGARAIALFVHGNNHTETLKKTYRDIAAGIIPAGRWGGRLVGSKAEITAAYRSITSGAAGPRPAKAAAAPEPAPAPAPPPRRTSAAPQRSNRRGRPRSRPAWIPTTK